MVTATFLERAACPACGEQGFRSLWRAAFDGPVLGPFLLDYYGHEPPAGDYWLCECRACRMRYQRMVGDDAFLNTVYSDWVGEWDPFLNQGFADDMADIRGSRDGHEIMTLASYLGKDIRDLKVLDYGSGYGSWAISASRLGATPYAIEMSEPRAKWLTEQGVTVITDADLADHRFDVANLEQVLEHVTEPLDLVRRLSGASIVKIGVPDASGVTAERIQRLENVKPVLPFEHINGFTQQSLTALASRAGRKRVRPALRDSYAFLWQRGFPKGLKRAAKELVRPIYRPPIYAWLA